MWFKGSFGPPRRLRQGSKMSILDKKSAWARAHVDGPLAVPDLYASVDLHFATQFIAERMEEGEVDVYTLKDRVRHQITQDKANGSLIARDRLFVFGELIAWAKNKRKLASAVSGLLHIGHGVANLTAPSMQMDASGYSLPITLADSHEALKVAYRDINALRGENILLKAEVAALTPYKDKADLIKHKGRVNGHKGGRPSIK